MKNERKLLFLLKNYYGFFLRKSFRKIKLRIHRKFYVAIQMEWSKSVHILSRIYVCLISVAAVVAANSSWQVGVCVCMCMCM